MTRTDPLYVTEAEIAQRVGLPEREWMIAVLALERQGFPKPEPLFGGRRYWPACRAFLDRRYQIDASSPAQGIPALDGEERWT